MNKKLIFIVSAPRSGSTLFLSYLCGLKNTKILYETKCLTNPLNFSPTNLVEYLAMLFDSFEEDIVIEKTPEHVHYLDVIEQLKKVCKRDIHVIYVTRPPVPTVLSILKAKEVLGVVDMLGACEKYEYAMISIHKNLVTNNISNSHHVSYRDLIDDSYSTLYNLLVKELDIDISDLDIKSLVDSRISNVTKVLPQILTEKHHTNVLRDIQDVEEERRSHIGKQITEGVSSRYNYIRNYFEHPITKETIYDLVISKKQSKEKFYLGSTDTPEVYVIVPLYNKQDYIEETLSSLANQTYKRTRVIIIDDASTDNSVSVVKRFLETLDPETRDRFSLLRYDRNMGVSFIRNKGLATCTDIISFCDADDIWDKELIEKSVATFKRYPYVDCVYSRVLIDKEGVLTKNRSKICNGDVYEDSLEYNFLTCGSNIFVKSSVIEEHSIKFNTSLRVAEDWDFLIQLAKVATFKCTKEYLVTYRHVPNSLSTNKELQVDNGKEVLDTYVIETKRFKRIFTRLYLYYFSIKNIKWKHIKDLDYSFIMRVVISKLKSLVKSYIS